MNIQESVILNKFINKLNYINTYRSKKYGASLKKPLLILLVISKIESGNIKHNRVYFSEIENDLSNIIKKFGMQPSKLTAPKPEQPFYHLVNDKIWDINLPEEDKLDFSKTISIKKLREPGVYSYFEQSLFELLVKSSSARKSVVESIICTWGSDKINKDLLYYLSLASVSCDNDIDQNYEQDKLLTKLSNLIFND